MAHSEITFYLNEQQIEGWETNDFAKIDIKAAADNLTSYEPGDVLRADLIYTTDDGDIIEESQSITLT